MNSDSINSFQRFAQDPLFNLGLLSVINDFATGQQGFPTNPAVELAVRVAPPAEQIVTKVAMVYLTLGGTDKATGKRSLEMLEVVENPEPEERDDPLSRIPELYRKVIFDARIALKKPRRAIFSQKEGDFIFKFPHELTVYRAYSIEKRKTDPKRSQSDLAFFLEKLVDNALRFGSFSQLKRLSTSLPSLADGPLLESTFFQAKVKACQVAQFASDPAYLEKFRGRVDLARSRRSDMLADESLMKEVAAYFTLLRFATLRGDLDMLKGLIGNPQGFDSGVRSSLARFALALGHAAVANYLFEELSPPIQRPLPASGNEYRPQDMEDWGQDFRGCFSGYIEI